MPGRKYYLNGLDDPMVQAYKKLAQAVAEEFHADPTTAAADMEDVVKLETDIANVLFKHLHIKLKKKLFALTHT